MSKTRHRLTVVGGTTLGTFVTLFFAPLLAVLAGLVATAISFALMLPDIHKIMARVTPDEYLLGAMFLGSSGCLRFVLEPRPVEVV